MQGFFTPAWKLVFQKDPEGGRITLLGFQQVKQCIFGFSWPVTSELKIGSEKLDSLRYNSPTTKCILFFPSLQPASIYLVFLVFTLLLEG